MTLDRRAFLATSVAASLAMPGALFATTPPAPTVFLSNSRIQTLRQRIKRGQQPQVAAFAQMIAAADVALLLQPAVPETWLLRGPEHVFEMTNPLYQKLVHPRDVLGKSVATALPEAIEQGYTALLDKVYKTGEVYRAHGARFTLTRSAEQGNEDLYVDLVYHPLREADNSISGIIVVGVDVTEARQNTLNLATTEADLRWTLQLNPHNPWTADAEGKQIDSAHDGSP